MGNTVWLPVTNDRPARYETVLSFHVGDLNPVPAYRMNEREWFRETEGPEDTYYPAGRHAPLLRPPTHFLYLDDLPRDERSEALKRLQREGQEYDKADG